MWTRNHLLLIGKDNGHANGQKVAKLYGRIEGRGKSVVCEAIVPGKLIKEVKYLTHALHVLVACTIRY